MSHLGIFLAILLVSACVSSSTSSSSSEFKIESAYKPEQCTRQVQNGDLVRFIYVGRLHDLKGHVFVGSHLHHGGSGKLEDDDDDEEDNTTSKRARRRRARDDNTFDYIHGQKGSLILDAYNAGMLGACEGEMRYVTIPPEMGMSKVETLQNIVPPDANVHYTLEVMQIIRGKKAIEEYRKEKWRKKRAEEL